MCWRGKDGVKKERVSLYWVYDAMGRMKSWKRFVDIDLEKYPLVCYSGPGLFWERVVDDRGSSIVDGAVVKLSGKYVGFDWFCLLIWRVACPWPLAHSW